MGRGKQRALRYASNILESSLCGVHRRRCCSDGRTDRLESSLRQLSSFPGFAQCAASEVKQHPAAQAVVTSVGQGRGRTGSSPWAGVAFGLASSLLSASVVSCEAASPGPDKDKGGQYHEVRKAVEEVWMEVEEDLSRDEAGLRPFLPPSIASSRPRPPLVEEVEKGRFRVSLQVREGLSPLAFMGSLYHKYGWTLEEMKEPGPAGLPFPLVAEKQGVKIVVDTSSLQRGAVRVSVELLGFGPGDSAKQEQLALLKQVLHAANSVVEVEKDDKGRITRSWSGTFSRGQDGSFHHRGEMDDRWDMLEKSAQDIWKSLVEDEEKRLRDMLSDLTSRLFDYQEQQRYPGYPGLGGDWMAVEPRVEDQAMGRPPDKPPPLSKEEQEFGSAAAAAAAEKLTSLGCVVYPPHSEQGPTNWDTLAGYTEQKQAIEETVLLALREPDVYDDVARATRETFDSNRARAILFEGPPGCGKTTAARIIAGQANVPLVYVPIECFQSKWYGESEKNLAEIMKLAEEVGQPSNGSILFLDELDSLAISRDQQMHEVTRRVLGVLLRSLDGFTRGRYIVIGATNRKQDLDLALRSRFSTSVFFDLPDADTREKIVGQYAKQLTVEERRKVASVTQGASGRDLKAVCEQAERRWAYQIIKGQAPRGSAPSLDLYMAAAAERRMGLHPFEPSDGFCSVV